MTTWHGTSCPRPCSLGEARRGCGRHAHGQVSSVRAQRSRFRCEEVQDQHAAAVGQLLLRRRRLLMGDAGSHGSDEEVVRSDSR